MINQVSILIPTAESVGVSQLTMPPRRGKKILAQVKRGTSAALGSRSEKFTLPLPIGWGEGRGEGLPLVAFVPSVPFAPYALIRGTPHSR